VADGDRGAGGMRRRAGGMRRGMRRAAACDAACDARPGMTPIDSETAPMIDPITQSSCRSWHWRAGRSVIRIGPVGRLTSRSFEGQDGAVRRVEWVVRRDRVGWVQDGVGGVKERNEHCERAEWGG
jgi:hypothetical protein